MLALVVSVLALLCGALALIRVYSGSVALDTPPGPAYDDSELRSGLRTLAELIDESRADYVQFKGDIVTAVDEGIRDVKRRENRVRATVRRAREELEDGGLKSPGLDAEALELFGSDGAGGEGGGVPAVPDNVASDQPGNRFAAFPGSFDGFGG